MKKIETLVGIKGDENDFQVTEYNRGDVTVVCLEGFSSSFLTLASNVNQIIIFCAERPNHQISDLKIQKGGRQYFGDIEIKIYNEKEKTESGAEADFVESHERDYK